jgi:hypothetical protein
MYEGKHERRVRFLYHEVSTCIVTEGVAGTE